MRDDLISRQAAIDALNTVYNEWQTQEAYSALEEATSMIEGLPSVQQKQHGVCMSCAIRNICKFRTGLGDYGYCNQWTEEFDEVKR